MLPVDDGGTFGANNRAALCGCCAAAATRGADVRPVAERDGSVYEEQVEVLEAHLHQHQVLGCTELGPELRRDEELTTRDAGVAGSAADGFVNLVQVVSFIRSNL